MCVYMTLSLFQSKVVVPRRGTKDEGFFAKSRVKDLKNYMRSKPSCVVFAKSPQHSRHALLARRVSSKQTNRYSRADLVVIFRIVSSASVIWVSSGVIVFASD